MRVKFQDVECFRDSFYDYSEEDDKTAHKEFSTWNPASLDDIRKEEEKPKAVKLQVGEPDMYTEMFATELGLRSQKNQSTVTDVEELDLSFLDYDAIDVPDRGINMSLNFSETKSKTEASIPNPNILNKTLLSNRKEVHGVNWTLVSLLSQSINESTIPVQNSRVKSTFNNYSANKTENETLFSNWTETDAENLTVVNSLNQSIGENRTHAFNISAALTFNSFSAHITENETLLSNWTEVVGENVTGDNSLNQSINENKTQAQSSRAESTFNSSSVCKTENTVVLLKNDSTSDVVSQLDNAGISDTKNTTVHNATALSVMGNVSTEMTNLTVTLPETNLTVTPTGNLSSILELERLNVTLSGDNQTVDSILVQDTEEKLIRRGVFSYSVPLDNSTTDSVHSTPEDYVSVITLSQREDENKTATNHVNVSTDATNRLLSIAMADAGEVNISSTDRHNLTVLVLEMTDNKTSDNDSLGMVPELEYGLQMNSSGAVIHSTNSSLKNVTHVVLQPQSSQNVTENTSRSISSEETSSESRENETVLFGKFNHTSSTETVSNETTGSGNLSLSSSAVKTGTLEDQSASDSSEEVFIYLKENSTEGIKTTSVKTQGHNWTYEGTHQMVPMDIPDHMMKYFENETPQKAPTPKKKKTVTLREKPEKGQGMKTRKRKEYKPQARSDLPFSPRGFNPGMTPRGSRPNAPKPVSDEEELINMPVVIGVPRADFSDYELYVPGREPDHIDIDEQDEKGEEYEYVSYKDPYSGHEDIKNLNLDETTKYYLKHSGPNVKTYFIAAEEVEWDYAGYGQR